MIDKKWEKYINDYNLHCKRIERATTLKQGESSHDKNKRIKKLEGDYASWFEYYFPHYAKVPCAKFHKKLARLVLNNPSLSLLAEIYRSGAKSVHLDMGIPLFLYVKKELKFMLLVGETADKAKKLLSDIQATFEHNQRFIDDYGRLLKRGSWTDGDFTLSDGTKFLSLGFGQSPRGVREMAERPDYIVMDDVDSKKRCNNDRLSRLAMEWAWEDLQGTFDEGAERRRFIVSNNNFHKNTIINQLKKEFQRLIKIYKEEGDEQEHFILSVSAVKDLENFEPAWPEKTDEKYWRKKYRKTPYRSFMREYMHKHIQDGTVFKNENVLYKARLRFSQYDALVFYGDLSYKDGGDYKGMPFIGKKGREYHLLAMYNRQGSRSSVAQWLYDKYEDLNLQKYNIRYYIEGLFAMDEFVNDFDLEGDNRGYHIPVESDESTKGNKYDRIEAMSSHYERQCFFIDEQLKDDPDVMLYVEHLLAFEKGNKSPVDALDGQQGAITKLNEATYVEQFNPKIQSRREVIHSKKNRY